MSAAGCNEALCRGSGRTGTVPSAFGLSLPQSSFLGELSTLPASLCVWAEVRPSIANKRYQSIPFRVTKY
jgi:hypothetical protein